MTKIFGATKVMLYIQDLPADLVAFLQHYAKQNAPFLSLVHWALPQLSADWMKESPSLDNQILWNRGQLLAVQHCLYDNMPHFDWLLFMDTDEMLVPHQKTSWPDLIKDIIGSTTDPSSKDDNTSSISFQSAFFQQDFQTLVTNSIDYFQYLHRTRNTSRSRAKVMVRPRAVFEVGIHHVSRPLSQDHHAIQAPLTSALLHHYRKCVAGGDMDSVQCDILVKDATILRFEQRLTVASRAVLADAQDLLSRLD